MTPSEFITKAIAAAREAGHIFPEYAACEAALESAWGKSQLARDHNNLFGCKQHKHPVYGTASLPTGEFEKPGVDIDGDGITGEGWVRVNAAWVKYPSWKESFTDRMETLRRVPCYKAALACTNGEDFVKEVSKHWATDPERANKVLSIYRKHIRNGIA